MKKQQQERELFFRSSSSFLFQAHRLFFKQVVEFVSAPGDLLDQLELGFVGHELSKCGL